jgi:hypothetical protein
VVGEVRKRERTDMGFVLILFGVVEFEFWGGRRGGLKI